MLSLPISYFSFVHYFYSVFVLSFVNIYPVSLEGLYKVDSRASQENHKLHEKKI